MKRLIPFFLLALPFLSYAQATVGLITYDTAAADGYILLSPMPEENTYLIDNCGRVVHTWVNTNQPGLETVLMKDGSIFKEERISGVFSGPGAGGRIIHRDWDGNLLWQYDIADSLLMAHHDFEVMPNGNVMMIAWEWHDEVEAEANGRNPTTVTGSLWSERLIELQPVGADSAIVVWEWRVWDHLVQGIDSTKANYGVVANEPGKLDLNFPPLGGQDWLHMNSVAYHPGLDQLMLSAHNFHEVWIIDHSTSTAEAATDSGGKYGRGGELLYRWGNPQTYDRGVMADKKLFGQHDPQWIADSLTDSGNVIIFNNGINRPGTDYSSVDIIAIPQDSAGYYTDPGSLDYGPASAYWSYSAPVVTDFYSSNISGAERLWNGGTLVCEGDDGRIFELDAAKNIRWEYVSPVGSTGVVTQGTVPVGNNVFRVHKYPVDYPAFTGRTLTPGDRIEIDPLPLPAACITTGMPDAQVSESLRVFPNPSAGEVQLKWNGDATPVQVTDLTGKMWVEDMLNPGRQVMNLQALPGGVYFIVSTHNRFPPVKLVILK